MGKILVKDTVYDAKVAYGGKTLSLTFEKMFIEDVAALLSENTAPEIREMNADGTTKAIYKNHALTRLTAETVGGKLLVTAVMQTSEIEQGTAEALSEQITALRAENAMLTECVLEMSTLVYA